LLRFSVFFGGRGPVGTEDVQSRFLGGAVEVLGSTLLFFIS